MIDIFDAESKIDPQEELIQREWDRFLQNIHRLEKSQKYELVTLFEYGYKIMPRQSSDCGPFGKGEADQLKNIPITIMAVTHGDEVGGIQVLSTYIEKLLLSTNTELLTFPIQIILGNPKAYQQRARFIDLDLNRCYAYAPEKGVKKTASGRGKSNELQRVKLIEEALKDTYILLDLHQTQTPTQRPFIITSQDPDSIKLAMSFRPPLSIVTKPKALPAAKFKNTTATKFVQHNSGIAFTLEMGFKGLDLKQVNLGMHWVEQAISIVKKMIDKGQVCFASGHTFDLEEIEQKWQDRLYIEEEAIFCEHIEGDLDAGWENFRPTHKGQRIGLCGEKELYSPIDGLMMFPKFKSGNYPVMKAPNDPICKIIRALELEEIQKMLQ